MKELMANRNRDLRERKGDIGSRGGTERKSSSTGALDYLEQSIDHTQLKGSLSDSHTYALADAHSKGCILPLNLHLLVLPNQNSLVNVVLDY